MISPKINQIRQPIKFFSAWVLLQAARKTLYVMCTAISGVFLGIMLDNRRGARVDDWGGLENRCGFRPTVGSNPTLSAERKIFLRNLSYFARVISALDLLKNRFEGQNFTLDLVAHQESLS